MSKRKEERAELNALLESLPIFGINHYEKMKIVTALLDGGYRYNPTVLREAAAAMRQTVNEHLHLSANVLDKRAMTMEDTL